MGNDIPSSWIKVDSGELFVQLRGINYNKKEATQIKTSDNILVLRGGNIQDGKIIENDDCVYVSKDLVNDSQLLKTGDVIIVSSTGSKMLIGKAAHAIEDRKDVSFGAFLTLLRPIKEIYYKFFDYFYQTNFYRESIRELSGGININNIRKEHLNQISFPLAPLPEQKRIVAKLDALFGHLDLLKTKLNHIPELLKNFRQQVLTQAVTGKLTEEWREGKELEEWRLISLRDFADCRLGKMLDQNKNIGDPTDYLRNTNVRWFSFDFENIAQMKVEKSEIKKFELKPNDILVCEGGEPGRSAIWRNERTDIIYQKALHRIRLNNNVLSDYFLYNLYIDASTHKLDELFTGTTIKHLTGQKFATYKILIPSIEEQKEIVKRVEKLFKIADKIETQYKILKEKIENLPQAILNKAFKGELVEQDERDEPASELLKRIKKEKDTGIQNTKTKQLKSMETGPAVAAEEGVEYKKSNHVNT